ncbi:MAG TPA: ATP-binding protein [Aquihabitans sp.]|nr:ATP-binding protein [Aquihabitans sp.]
MCPDPAADPVVDGRAALDVTARARLAFAADPAELARVRDFATRAAADLAPTVDPGLLAVVVGELAANAAVHQTGAAEIVLELVGEGVLEVAVHDPSPALPRLVEEAPWSTSGHRGIQLVAALSQAWGVEALPGGKRVWARLAAAGPTEGDARTEPSRRPGARPTAPPGG